MDSGPAPIDDLIEMSELVSANAPSGIRRSGRGAGQSLPDQSFGVDNIALFSARGKLVHAAGSAAAGQL